MKSRGKQGVESVVAGNKSIHELKVIREVIFENM